MDKKDKEKKKVLVVGAGALGSHVVQIGRNLPVNWKVMDNDHIEMKNVFSQFHSKMGLGKNKTNSLQQVMNGIFGCQITSIPYRLTEGNVVLLKESELVIDCVDNIATRRLISKVVRENKIPCLHGALAADGQFGLVRWDEGFEPDSEDTPGQPTCDGGEFLPLIVEVASLLVYTIQVFLNSGRKVGFMVTPESKILI